MGLRPAYSSSSYTVEELPDGSRIYRFDGNSVQNERVKVGHQRSRQQQQSLSDSRQSAPKPSPPSRAPSKTVATVGAEATTNMREDLRNEENGEGLGTKRGAPESDAEDAMMYRFQPQSGFETPLEATPVIGKSGRKKSPDSDEQEVSDSEATPPAAAIAGVQSAGNAEAFRKTVLDWLQERIDNIEDENPTGAFAARTVLKWATSPEEVIRAAQGVIDKPPKWEEVEELLSPWLQPFPAPLESVRSPTDLAGPDSRFVRVLGLKLHYIQAFPRTAASRPKAPTLVLMHGFNGCTFSWRHVMQELADAVGGRVIAFDRPPFGLSERPTQWNGGIENSPYSAAAGVNLTTALTRALGLGKYVLVGHSAGAPIAATAATQSDRCQGLVLVAPAVSLPKDWDKKKDADGSSSLSSTDDRGNSSKQWPVPVDNFNTILRIAYTGAVIRVPGVGISYVRASTEKQAKELREKGVDYPCPYDDSPITVAEGYLKPLDSSNWDVGVLEHYKALLNEGGLLAPGPSREELPKKVLIIQGETDPTVPAWVARAYADAQGGFDNGMIYEEYKNIGHLPMEQAPAEFVKSIKQYCDGI